MEPCLEVSDMDKEPCYSRMVPATKENGIWAMHMVKASSHTSEVKHMKENGLIRRDMVLV